MQSAEQEIAHLLQESKEGVYVKNTIPRIVQLFNRLDAAMNEGTHALNKAEDCRQEIIGLLGNCAFALRTEDGDPSNDETADTCDTISDMAIDPFERFERPMWVARLRQLIENPAFNPDGIGVPERP